MYSYSCENEAVNTGLTGQCANTLTSAVRFILTPLSTSIATKALAMTKSTWTDLLRNSDRTLRAYITGLRMGEIEVMDTEDQIIESTFKGDDFVSSGRNKIRVSFNVNPYFAKQYIGLNGQWRVFAIDANGNIDGLTVGTAFKGRVANVRVLKIASVPQGELAKVTMEITYMDTQLYNLNRDYVSPYDQTSGWDPKSELDGLQWVTVATVGSWSATGGAVSVTYAHNGEPVTWLDETNFAIPGKTISSATYNPTDLDYDIVSTALTTSAINLDGIITTGDTGLESSGSSAFTVA